MRPLRIRPINVPLETTTDGTVRVRGTRVPLDSVVTAFYLGSTPEEIAQQFSPLEIADIYGVLAFYLQRKDEVDVYLREREAEAKRLRATIEARWRPDGVRERLMARRKHQTGPPNDPAGG
jgi:uncharacterized protein (DUF433 family)